MAHFDVNAAKPDRSIANAERHIADAGQKRLVPDYKINRVDELLPWNTELAADPEADR